MAFDRVKIINMARQGMRDGEVASKIGCTVGTAARIRIESGLRYRSLGIDRDRLKEYAKAGLSDEDIAKRLECETSSIGQLRQRMGILKTAGYKVHPRSEYSGCIGLVAELQKYGPIASWKHTSYEMTLVRGRYIALKRRGVDVRRITIAGKCHASKRNNGRANGSVVYLPGQEQAAFGIASEQLISHNAKMFIPSVARMLGLKGTDRLMPEVAFEDDFQQLRKEQNELFKELGYRKKIAKEQKKRREAITSDILRLRKELARLG